MNEDKKQEPTTLLIFHLPSGSYVSCGRSRLGGIPHQGDTLILNNEEVEVVGPVHSFATDGNSQLMELLQHEHSNAIEAAKALTGIVNLDATLGQSRLTVGPDKVVLIRTKTPGSDGLRLGTPFGKGKKGTFSLNLDLKSLMGGQVTVQSLLGRSPRRTGNRTRKS